MPPYVVLSMIAGLGEGREKEKAQEYLFIHFIIKISQPTLKNVILFLIFNVIISFPLPKAGQLTVPC